MRDSQANRRDTNKEILRVSMRRISMRGTMDGRSREQAMSCPLSPGLEEEVRKDLYVVVSGEQGSARLHHGQVTWQRSHPMQMSGIRGANRVVQNDCSAKTRAIPTNRWWTPEVMCIFTAVCLPIFLA